MRWSAPTPAPTPARSSARCCATASSTTAKSKSRCRRVPRPTADLRDPRHARRADGDAQPRRHLRQGVRHAAPSRKRMTVADSHRVLVAEESDKLLDQEMVVREAITAVEQNGIVFIDEIDKICGAASGRRRRADVSREGRAARSAAADRGHDGRDQVRRGQDRPHPVHRLGRLPPGQALRPAARAAGAVADPGRTEGARPRRLPAHPGRAGGEPDQAVQGAAGDRGGRRSNSTTRRSTSWPCWPRRSTRRSRISARAGCTQSSSGCSRRSASPPPISPRAPASRSTAPMSATGSAPSRKTPTSPNSFFKARHQAWRGSAIGSSGQMGRRTFVNSSGV